MNCWSEGEHPFATADWSSIAHLAYHLGAVRQINQAARGLVEVKAEGEK